MTKWFENDDLFVRECEQGHKWERHVAKKAANKGLDVEASERSIRDHVSERSEYEQETDLRLEGRLFEIKSRRCFFRFPHEFPYETLFVDTVKGWDRKDPKPDGVLCVSRVTGAIIGLATATESKWATERRYDSVRGIEDEFYLADKDLWFPFRVLVEHLKEIS